MDEIIKLLMNMGKTREEAIEFVGKEMPKGGIDDVGSNIIKPITKKVAGDYPLIGSRITDPTQQGQFGKYFIQTLDPKDRYNLIRQSIDDQKENWQKTFEFIRTGGYKLSDLQKQNLNYNLGVLQRSKIVLTDITKGLESQKIDVEELYSSFVKNKRFLGNESTGLSSEGEDILEYINKTKEKIEDLTKTGKKQEEILSQQKKDNDARMKRLYNGRAYEKNDGNYRALGGYHLPKLHEAGIINLDPKIYEAIKKGQYHHGGADFFAPDPNRVLQYHFGTKIFDDLDDAINKAAMDGEVPLKGEDGMIKFLKDNDYLPFKKDGPANALDYLNDVEKLERVKELDSATKTIKSGQSNFYKTPDQIMDRVMQNANDKKLYLESFKRTHPGKFKLYEKNISEEPFFGVDIGQNDLFSDLSDLSFPKDKGDLLPFPKKEGIKAVDDDKRLLTDDEIIDYEAELGDSETWMMEGTVGEAKKALKDRKDYEAEMFGLYKAGKLDPEAGSVTRARLNFLKNKLEEAELSGDNRLISEDEIFELEGLTKKFRKEDLEFKVQEQPDRKLTDEEIQELKDLTDDDPDFDMAEGGIIKLAKGGRIGFRSAGFISGRTKSSQSNKSSGSTNREKGIMSRGQGPRGTTKSTTTFNPRDTNTSNKEGVTLKEIQKTTSIYAPETDVLEREVIKKLKSLIPADLNKDKQALLMMKLKEKYFPTKRINDPFFRNTRIKDKEINLLDTNLLDFKLKHPNISIENEVGMIDRDKLKTVIDNAQIVGDASLLNDTLQLSRNLDTMGAGITGIDYIPNKYFNLTSSNVEDRNYDLTGKLPVGPFNLSSQLNYLDNELVDKTRTIDYDQDGVKGSYVVNNDSVKRNLDLDKNYNIGNFDLGLKGGYDDVKYDDGYSNYSSSLTPKISYSSNIGDGIFKTNVAKEIIDGGQVPNLSASYSLPLSSQGFTFDDNNMVIRDDQGVPLQSNINYGTIGATANNLLSSDRNFNLTYDYKKGLPGNNNYLEFKAKTNPLNIKDSALFLGLTKKF